MFLAVFSSGRHRVARTCRSSIKVTYEGRRSRFDLSDWKIGGSGYRVWVGAKASQLSAPDWLAKVRPHAVRGPCEGIVSNPIKRRPR